MLERRGLALERHLRGVRERTPRAIEQGCLRHATAACPLRRRCRDDRVDAQREQRGEAERIDGRGNEDCLHAPAGHPGDREGAERGQNQAACHHERPKSSSRTAGTRPWTKMNKEHAKEAKEPGKAPRPLALTWHQAARHRRSERGHRPLVGRKACGQLSGTARRIAQILTSRRRLSGSMTN